MKKFLSALLVTVILSVALLPAEAFAATAPTGTVMFSATLESNMYDSAKNNYYGKTGTWFDAGNGKYAFVMTKSDGGKIYCSDKYYQISGTKYWFSGGYTTTKPKDPNANPQVNPDPGYQPVGPAQPIAPPHPSTAYAERWEIQNNGSWKFIKSNGEYARNQFVDWKDNRYYLDPNGIMVTGKYSISDKEYLFSYGDKSHPEGALIRSDWLLVDGYWYYANSNGVIRKNTSINWNNNDYQLCADGKMATGLTKIGSDTYYFNDGSIGGLPCGAMLKRSWLYLDGYYYYFGSDGIAYRNTNKTIGGYLYRFDNECHYY